MVILTTRQTVLKNPQEETSTVTPLGTENPAAGSLEQWEHYSHRTGSDCGWWGWRFAWAGREGIGSFQLPPGRVSPLNLELREREREGGLYCQYENVTRSLTLQFAWATDSNSHSYMTPKWKGSVTLEDRLHMWKGLDRERTDCADMCAFAQSLPRSQLAKLQNWICHPCTQQLHTLPSRPWCIFT